MFDDADICRSNIELGPGRRGTYPLLPTRGLLRDLRERGSPYNPLPTNGNSLQRRNAGKQDTDITVDDFVPVSTTPQNAPGTAPAPTGSTTAPTSVTQTAGTMNGSVDPKMGTVSVCKFQWGDTTDYGNEANCATTPSGADDKSVSAA